MLLLAATVVSEAGLHVLSGDFDEDLCFQLIQDYNEGREVVENTETIVQALREVYGEAEAWVAKDLEARVFVKLSHGVY